MKAPNIIKVAFGGVSAILSYMYGSMDSWLNALVCVCVLDYITGVVQAIFNKNLNSEIGFKGIAKKLLIFLIVALANILDNVMQAGGLLRVAVIGFYIANEGLSILENGGKMGLQYPQKLKSILEQLKEEEKEHGN